jgi:HEPN domain-containing protein
MSEAERMSDVGSPGTWLAYARSDLALARTRPENGVMLESLCFHAQQAAEKSVKAVLVLRGVDFPRTHDLATLLRLLPGDIQRPACAERLPELTVYAVQFRYPPWGGIDMEDYEEALETASATFEWARQLIKGA